MNEQTKKGTLNVINYLSVAFAASPLEIIECMEGVILDEEEAGELKEEFRKEKT